jgi:hypothetical protein
MMRRARLQGVIHKKARKSLRDSLAVLLAAFGVYSVPITSGLVRYSLSH